MTALARADWVTQDKEGRHLLMGTLFCVAGPWGLASGPGGCVGQQDDDDASGVAHGEGHDGGHCLASALATRASNTSITKSASSAKPTATTRRTMRTAAMTGKRR
jgi:hypothetical protein